MRNAKQLRSNNTIKLLCNYAYKIYSVILIYCSFVHQINAARKYHQLLTKNCKSVLHKILQHGQIPLISNLSIQASCDKISLIYPRFTNSNHLLSTLCRDPILSLYVSHLLEARKDISDFKIVGK